MKEKILTFLRRQEGFVSGQMICEELGVTRSAIWKYIKALRQEGYEIESVTSKGYRLKSSPDLVSEEELASWLQGEEFAARIHCYDTVDSTNEEAKRAAAAGEEDRSFFVADRQTAGKGRRGRSWLSPGGEDLFFSILLRPAIPPQTASMLTIIAALAGAAAAKKHSGETCKIKWPNDILLHDRKICGILTEMVLEMNEIDYVVVGVGFNLNRLQFDEEIAKLAGSIRRETGRKVVRAAFFADYVKEFSKRYRKFLDAGTLAPFMEEYNELLISKGRQVMLVKKGQELVRTSGGINENGELIVYDDAGRQETVFSGEVSVRGLYGYV